MRWWLVVLVLLLSACASQPKTEHRAAFETYWHCAYSAAAQRIPDRQLPAREAAMRAQAHCYDAYRRYKAAKTRHVRSVVSSRDYEMADALAGQSSLQRKKDVTRRLTRLITQARQ